MVLVYEILTGIKDSIIILLTGLYLLDYGDNGKPSERVGRKAKGPYLMDGSQLPNHGLFVY